MDTAVVLEAWMTFQRTWLYLEPIFGSEDIMRQMPSEGRKFERVDALWRRIMACVVAYPRVMDVVESAALLQAMIRAGMRCGAGEPTASYPFARMLCVVCYPSSRCVLFFFSARGFSPEVCNIYSPPGPGRPARTRPALRR